jgi:hypothetical protein
LLTERALGQSASVASNQMLEQCVVVSAFRGRHCASGCVDTKPKVKLGYAH